MALVWQVIDQQSYQDGGDEVLMSSIRTERARIPGGWLVRACALRRELTHPRGGEADVESGIGLTLTFVPDPGGVWA